jgi:polar amino acid transport system substrate-binding protein
MNIGKTPLLRCTAACLGVAFVIFSITAISLPSHALPPTNGADTRQAVQNIKFLTHSLSDATYVGDDGLLHGRKNAGRRAFYVEVVMAMLAEMDAQSLIEEASLNRGLSLLESQENYAFFNLIKNDARKDKFKWVGPISVFPTYLYELKARPTNIQTIEDAKKVRGLCVIKGNNVVGLLKRLGFTNLIEATSNDACGRQLKHGRAALVTGSAYPWFTGDAELSQLFTRTAVTLSIDEGFIALSRSVPDLVIAAMQQALDRTKTDGTYGQLRLDYLVQFNDVSKPEKKSMRGRRTPIRPN